MNGMATVAPVFGWVFLEWPDIVRTGEVRCDPRLIEAASANKQRRANARRIMERCPRHFSFPASRQVGDVSTGNEITRPAGGPILDWKFHALSLSRAFRFALENAMQRWWRSFARKCSAFSLRLLDACRYRAGISPSLAKESKDKNRVNEAHINLVLRRLAH